jgi:hypothetical protein
MTTFRALAIALVMMLSCGQALAQLKAFEDYDYSENVWTLTTVQVHANMIDSYLEGIKETWVASQEVAKGLDQVEDYFVYVSELPNSGDFNVLLVSRHASAADLVPTKARNDAFMTAWGAEREARTQQLTKDYPSMRDITGEYRLRRINFK